MTTTVLAYIPSPSQGVWYLFGVVPLRAYALCIIAGIIAALVIGDRRWVARGGERGIIYDVALWAVPFGLIGGRLYHVMTDWPKYFGSDGAGFLAALRIYDGGLGIWGAVALGGVGAWIACRRRDIPLPAFGDAIAPGIILAQAIGRLGNYFNQELYGRETDLPWGLTIWERLDPSGVVSPHSLDGVSTGQVYAVVHPTFLYELIWNLLIFALLIWADRRFKLGHGRLFALYVAGYCVGRFGVELMRSDTATLIAGIRVNTFTSMFVFIGAVIYIMVAPKGREDPATLGGNDAVGDRESALDGIGEELTAVAATSGVVAAAKVAGDEDTADTPSTSMSVADDGREASLGSVEGDEAVEAEEGAPEVHEAAVAAAADADSFAEDIAEDVSEGDAAEPVEVPAVALEGTEVAEALNAEVEPEPEAEADATAVSAEADPEDGLGSVDGDEVAGAQDDAAEVHAAAVTGAEDAEALADDVASESDAETSATETEPTDGLGSVDGDEVAAAEDDAAEVHDAAVDGAADAETVAAEVADEDPTEDAATEQSPPEDVAAEDTAAVTDDSTEEPTDGLGSVDGDEVAAAEDVAAEDTAAVTDDSTEEPTDGLGSVDGDEVAAAEDVAAEDTAAVTDDSTEEPTDGLGSVDRDEVAAAKDDAAEVHDATVDGAAEAETVAAEVADEDPTEDAATDQSPPEDVAAEDTAAVTDDSTEEPTDGLGSVDGDEVAAAEDDAAEVHDATVDGAAEAEAVAEDVAAEDTTAAPANEAPTEQPRRRWWRRG